MLLRNIPQGNEGEATCPTGRDAVSEKALAEAKSLREESPEKEENHQRSHQKVLQHQFQGEPAAKVMVDQSPSIIGDYCGDHDIELKIIAKAMKCAAHPQFFIFR